MVNELTFLELLWFAFCAISGGITFIYGIKFVWLAIKATNPDARVSYMLIGGLLLLLSLFLLRQFKYYVDFLWS